MAEKAIAKRVGGKVRRVKVDDSPTEKHTIEITIKATQGSGNTRLHKIIKEALEKEGYKSTSLNPIPELGMEDRSLIYDEDTHIHLITVQMEPSPHA